MANVKKNLDELQDYCKCKDYKELATHLGIKANTLYSWVSRNKIGAPEKILARHKEISLAWLMTSEGPMIEEAGGPKPEPQKQPESLADFYEYAAVSLRVLFDFISDEYGQDAVACVMFLRDQERINPAYRAWLVQKKDSFAGLRDGRSSKAA